jgi:hypothetical protein
MKLFELKDKNNQTTDLFKIENFTNVTEVIDVLNKFYILEDEGVYPLCESEFRTKLKANYVYVMSDGCCSFVETLTEFDEGFQNESDWKVNSSVEVI